MTWDAYHRRKDVLREMLAVADRRPDATLVELIDGVDGARAAFPTDDDALLELQMTWFQRLSGRLDRLLSEGTEPPELVPVTAWVMTAAELPGVRALLDVHRDEPVLRKAVAKEAAYLALSGGSFVRGVDLTSHGRRLQQAARDELAATPEVAQGRCEPSPVICSPISASID